MWQSGEIKQDDSGLVVSNKLDAEFARIQSGESATSAQFNNLQYTDTTTILDATKDKLIVSPYTMWFVLDPLFARVDNSEKVTDHLGEILFDGTFWIRSDVMMEYSGAYVDLADMDTGFFITKAHLDQYNDSLGDSYLKTDGTSQLITGYIPVNDLDVATKLYVDTVKDEMGAIAQSSYTEFPPAVAGQTVFSITVTQRNYIVFLNGILQRKDKFQDNGTNITFLVPLDENDEVTVVITGGV